MLGLYDYPYHIMIKYFFNKTSKQDKLYVQRGYICPFSYHWIVRPG